MRRLVAILAVLLLAPWTEAAADPPSVTRTPVLFQVRNLNRSALACPADGRPYEIRGELLAPAGAPPSRVVLALHEFSFGRFFWSFRDAPGYDTAAEMARHGQAWVVVDRLGYDDSGHPPGGATCLGAQADITAQLVRALHSGRYRAGAGAGARFRDVVLAGHSVGGGIAELAAHSFPDLPLAGLALFAWADHSYSSRTVGQSLDQAADCARGGEPAEPGAAGGYAWFGRTEAQFRRNMFADADWSVVDAATRRRNRDPCGDSASLARMALVNRLGVGEVALPVLVVFGERDPVFEAGAAEKQAALFSASPRVTVHTVPRAAHALTLERAAPQVRTLTRRWLAEQAPG